jgi:hypothetical protein
MRKWMGAAVVTAALALGASPASAAAPLKSAVQTAGSQKADSQVVTDVSGRRYHRHYGYRRYYRPYPHYYARPYYYRPYPYSAPAPFTFGFGFGPWW